jgi:putative PIN family toxin of toxin-antitoxin system
MGSPSGIVLDTNIVLDMAVFRDPGVATILHRVESGALRALVSQATMEELRRVLAYPAFAQSEAQRGAALLWYGSVSERVDVPDPADCPLRCRADPDDQKFLDLAWAAGARFLITKDKALLALSRRAARQGRFEILAPEDFLPAPT